MKIRNQEQAVPAPEGAERDPATTCPACHKQQAEWIMNELNRWKNIGSLNAQKVIEVESVDLAALERALVTLAERHESLRTTFHFDGGEVVQKVHAPGNRRFQYIDLRAEESPSAIAQSIIDNERKQYFDFAVRPPLSTLLIQLEECHFIFVFTINHIITDGWSLEIIHRELLALYGAYCAGTEPVLPPVVQSREFAAWEDGLIHTAAGNRHRQYWQRKLSGNPPVHYLSDYYLKSIHGANTSYRVTLESEIAQHFPHMQQAPYYDKVFGLLHRVVTHPGASYRFLIDQALLKRIEAVSRAVEATPFSFIQAACYALLFRLTGRPDVIIGVPIAVRNDERMVNTIGWMVNTLLLRSRVNEDQPFVDYLGAVHADFTEAYGHNAYPLERVLEQADLSLDALGCLSLNYMDYGTARRLNDFRPGHLRGNFYPYFDIDCHLTRFVNGCEVTCIYKTELFSARTIEFIFQRYEELLGALCDNPSAPVGWLLGLPPPAVSRSRLPLPGTARRSAFAVSSFKD